MKYLVAAFGLALVTALSAPSAAFAGQLPSAQGFGGSSNPLTPAQIVSEFTKLPMDTQKALIKILVSKESAVESRMTTQEIDSIYATLPADVQRNLYVQWDALSDEQRIALKKMDPDMIKSMLGAAVAAEIGGHALAALSPVKNLIDEGASLATESRAYVQNLLWR